MKTKVYVPDSGAHKCLLLSDVILHQSGNSHLASVSRDAIEASVAACPHCEAKRRTMQVKFDNFMQCVVSPLTPAEKEVGDNDKVLRADDSELIEQARLNCLNNFFHAQSIPELLTYLFRYARQYGFANIRFYRYSPEEAKLVSVACVGHEAAIAERFRKGYIVRLVYAQAPDDVHSFWCFKLERPVIISVCQRTVTRLKYERRADLDFITVPTDYCGYHLAGHKGSTWIDIPLKVAGKFVGKFSCDVDINEVGSDLRSRIDEFFYLCQVAAPYLQAHVTKELSICPALPASRDALNDWPDAAQISLKPLIPQDTFNEFYKCASLKEFLQFCTNSLPQAVFRAENASLYTLCVDSSGSQKLVLRKSSHLNLIDYEERAFYNLDEPGPTPWVARKKLPLRIQDYEDKRELRAILQQYDNQLVWDDKFLDSDCKKSFLATPIVDPKGDLLGVVRLTDKQGEMPYFTERDEKALIALSNNLIGPRLHQLLNVDLPPELSHLLDDIVGIAVRDVLSTLEVIKLFDETLQALFATRSGRKAFLLNTVDSQQRSFRANHIGGDLPCDPSEGPVFLKGTLPGIALENPGAAFLSHDFQTIGVSRRVRQCCPEAVAAIVNSITFRNTTYAVLEIFSDRFDILHAANKRLIEIMCAQAGAVYARHRSLSGSTSPTRTLHAE